MHLFHLLNLKKMLKIVWQKKIRTENETHVIILLFPIKHSETAKDLAVLFSAVESRTPVQVQKVPGAEESHLGHSGFIPKRKAVFKKD